MLIYIKFHTSPQHKRCMTILVEKSMPFDLRTLRSFRCLRPLKMVSKVPSKFNPQYHFTSRHAIGQEVILLLRFGGYQRKNRNQRYMIKRQSSFMPNQLCNIIFDSHSATKHESLCSYEGQYNHVCLNYLLLNFLSSSIFN